MDDVVLVGAAASPPPQAAPAPADVDDEADADDGPVLTAAERGLTLETWQDRPVSKANNQQQLKILAEEFKPLLDKIEYTLDQLRDTATSLAEAGIAPDEGNYFEDIDRTVKQLLDEAELVRLRRRALGELQQALAAAGELDDVQGRYRADCKQLEGAYLAKTARQRFSRNATYIAFREAVWESHYGNEQAMPAVVDLIPRDEGEQDDDDDGSDDEIQQGGQVQTFRDPITLTLLEDPYTSTVCPHSYSRATIIQYLEGAAKECPVSGCNKFITAQTIKADHNLAKRIAADQRRKERAEAARGDADDDVEELDDD